MRKMLLQMLLQLLQLLLQLHALFNLRFSYCFAEFDIQRPWKPKINIVTAIINDTVAAVATEAKHLPFLGSGPGRG